MRENMHRERSENHAVWAKERLKWTWSMGGTAESFPWTRVPVEDYSIAESISGGHKMELLEYQAEKLKLEPLSSRKSRE